jgi:peptide deformylase
MEKKMIQPICRMGNPKLRSVNKDLEIDSIKGEVFGRLLADLIDSMKHYGGIGIAAPQIGVNLRVAIIELPETNRYGQKIQLPLTVFINPVIEFLTDELQGFWEGCLSVPGLRGFVERPSKIKVSFYDEKGKFHELIAEGFLATVIQHELDHLEGVLYVDRIKDPAKFAFQEEYDQYVFNQKEIGD